MEERGLSRRRLLSIGGAGLAGGLAGCSGGSGEGDSNDGTTTDEPTASEDTETQEGPESKSTERSEPYGVEMVPVGEVTFDGVPDRWLAYESGYADMGVALGKADGLAAVGNLDRYHTHYYDEIDGVDVESGNLVQLLGEGYEIDKELFYELDVDVHLADPNWLTDGSAFNLDADDVEEVRGNVAPFVGNTIFRRTDGWHDYRYYTLYEAFEKVAEVFQREERFEAFERFHDEYVARVQTALPHPDDRPTALLTFAGGEEPEEFYPYRLADRGTNNKQFHDLGVEDALAGTGVSGLSTTDRGTIDYETMLDIDPDTILVRGHEGKSHGEFADSVLSHMQGHPIGSELTAVEEGRVFRGGPVYQGPIQHLFTLERAATELYPGAFEGELFDRTRVAEIIAGNA